MTPSQVKAKEYAEILLAFSRGEKVECLLFSGEWGKAENMQFPTIQYRIAPKPVERWGVIDRDGNFWGTYDNPQAAVRAALDHGGRYFLLREVLE